MVPAVALSAEQMARLTIDIAWLVEESVTLADGSTQRVLVPRILATGRQVHLAPEDALLVGNDVALDTAGELFTSGTVAGCRAVFLTGRSLRGLYNGEGNAKQGRSDVEKIIHEAWSGVAILPSAPFAAAELLQPEVWQAISIFLKAAK